MHELNHAFQAESSQNSYGQRHCALGFEAWLRSNVGALRANFLRTKIATEIFISWLRATAPAGLGMRGDELEMS